MQRILLLFRIKQTLIFKKKLYVIQQQVPLPLPCFNFAQIAIPSLTPRVVQSITSRVCTRKCFVEKPSKKQ